MFDLSFPYTFALHHLSTFSSSSLGFSLLCRRLFLSFFRLPILRLPAVRLPFTACSLVSICVSLPYHKPICERENQYRGMWEPFATFYYFLTRAILILFINQSPARPPPDRTTAHSFSASSACLVYSICRFGMFSLPPRLTQLDAAPLLLVPLLLSSIGLLL